MLNKFIIGQRLKYKKFLLCWHPRAVTGCLSYALCMSLKRTFLKMERWCNETTLGQYIIMIYFQAQFKRYSKRYVENKRPSNDRIQETCKHSAKTSFYCSNAAHE